MKGLSKKTVMSNGKKVDGRAKTSQKFVVALAVVSISGFLIIIMQAFFDFDLSPYLEPLLMFVIGIGLAFEGRITSLRSLRNGLNSRNLSHLTTTVIGFIAIIAGIFSIPQIRIDHPLFLSTKGIISIIAIIVIVVQTWFSSGK